MPIDFPSEFTDTTPDQLLGANGSTPSKAAITAKGRAILAAADVEPLTAAEKTKLGQIDQGATDDQTGAEIEAALDAHLGNTDWKTPGGGSGTVDVVSNVAENTILGRTTAGSGDSEELSASAVRTLLNVEDGATVDQTGAEIKAAYEAEADTNAFTDADQTKLAGIADGADVTPALATVATSGSYTDLSDVPAPGFLLGSDPTGIAGATAVTNIVQISQTDFDALPSTDANTIYFINGA